MRDCQFTPPGRERERSPFRLAPISAQSSRRMSQRGNSARGARSATPDGLANAVFHIFETAVGKLVRRNMLEPPEKAFHRFRAHGITEPDAIGHQTPQRFGRT